MSDLRAGIVGASGYTGSELIRILSTHGNVEISAVTSESNAGSRVSEKYPHLESVFDGEFISSGDLKMDELDMLFLALPHTVSMKYVKEVWETGIRIVDLSGDFRLSSVKTYEEWYHTDHVCPELNREAVFGMPELFREEIKGSRFVSNPGCYPTSAILGLAPLLKDKLVDPDTIVVDSKSGVTGAGAKAKTATHFPTANEDFRAYKIGAHRHTPEIEDALSIYSGLAVRAQFTPHLLPINRGILTTSYCNLRDGVTREDIKESVEILYGNEPFVRIRDTPPNVQAVRGSNFCDIHVHHDQRTNRAIVITAIDNLVKGASGQAVQNMNLMMGFDEREGLRIQPLSP